MQLGHASQLRQRSASAHPVEANGMGACTLRYKGDKKGTGQIFDTHFVEFTYADGTKMYSQCRHMPGTWTYVGEGLHGTAGTANPSGSIEGENAWRFRGENVNSMVQEHKDLIAAIRSGDKYNEGWHGAASSMTSVLGRMATYSGKIVKWDDAVAEGTTEFPSNLAWDAPAPVSSTRTATTRSPSPASTSRTKSVQSRLREYLRITSVARRTLRRAAFFLEETERVPSRLSRDNESGPHSAFNQRFPAGTNCTASITTWPLRHDWKPRPPQVPGRT